MSKFKGHIIYKNIPYSKNLKNITEIDVEAISKLEVEVLKNPELLEMEGLKGLIDRKNNPEKRSFLDPRILDVYTSAEIIYSGTDRPSVMAIHGGSWIAGSKDEEDFSKICKHLVDNGYVAVSIDYGLAPFDGSWPIMIDHCTEALEWMHNSSGYNIANSRIGVLGASAGGHLASCLSVQEETRDKLKCVVDFFAPTNIIQSLGLEKEMCWFSQLIQDIPALSEFFEQCVFDSSYEASREHFCGLSPYYTIPEDAAMPPTLSYHGENDPIVACGQSKRYHATLRDIGHESTLVVDQGNHNIPGDFLRGRGELYEKSMSFLERNLKE